MSVTKADPEKHFELEMHLSVVDNEDYELLTSTLDAIRNKYSRGGSSVSIERVNPDAVVNR
jgi:hypothetical protein